MSEQNNRKEQGIPLKALALLFATLAVVALLLGLNSKYSKEKTPPITLAEADKSFKKIIETPKEVTSTLPINREICVFNSTTIPNYAMTVADELRSKGWNIYQYANYIGEEKSETTISYPRGQKNSALALKKDYNKVKNFEIQNPELTGCAGKLVLILK